MTHVPARQCPCGPSRARPRLQPRGPARLRPWVEAAQRTARRNLHLFTPASRVQLLAREAVLRLATWPFLAPLIERPLNREEERL
jgi:hypothetical protein